MIWKAAFCGYGNIAEIGHTSAITKLEDYLYVCAVADPTLSRLQVAKKHFPTCHLYSSLEEMYRNENVDVLIVCAPPIYHQEAIRYGLAHNSNVVCEKPLIINLEYDELIMAAQKKQRLWYPCHNYKFAPAILKAKEYIHQHDLGSPKHIFLTTLRQTHASGVKAWNPDWRRQKDIAGGGILTDHGIHSVYLSVFFAEELPISYTGTIQHVGHTNFFETEDTAIATLVFPGGAISQIYLTWTASRRYSQILIEMERGSITINDDVLTIRDCSNNILHEENTAPTAFNDPSHAGWYEKMYRDILKQLESGISIPFHIEEAKIATQVIQSIYSSAERDWAMAVHSPSDKEYSP